MKKFILIFIFVFIVFAVPSKSQITKYFGSFKVSIDETGVINFLRYLDGTFYAEDVALNRAAKIMSPMFYAISDDGKVGYGWFCRSHLSNACTDDFVAYQIVEFCREYAKINCSIFAYKNKIVWNNINIEINDLSFAKNIELFKKLNLYKDNSPKKISEVNYLTYLHLDSDKCTSKKNSSDYNNLRGANADCLLPGRYELTTNDKSGNNYD
jgi:hypothetical protein